METITAAQMNAIHEQVKTPYKSGAILSSSDYYYDSPVVFKHDGTYYMTCVEIDRACQTGYRTKLSVSNDLINWREKGYILTENNGWDCAQTGGYAQFIDNTFGGSNEIRAIDGKYIIGYIGGAHKGYETDPLWIGLATCDEISDVRSYRKRKEPILTTQDSDCRIEESRTLFKPAMFMDEKRTTGHPYVCAYNAKRQDGRESIFLAVSDDGYHWSRYLDRAIISVGECDPCIRINGDPQIVMIDGLYVMFYFIYDNIHQRAWNTFAVSDDLIHWKKWEGQPLVESEYPWEDVYAHKQWIIKEGGIVYHFYCAVNRANERFIALATSEPIERQEKVP